MENFVFKPNLVAFISPATVVFLLLIFAAATPLPIIGVGIFSLLYLVMPFYALYPTLNVEQANIQKYGLTHLDAQSHPTAKRIVELLEKAEIKKNVTIFVSDRDDLDGPFAFGTFRKNFLAIPAWFLSDYPAHPDEYDAVLFHEIAHIKFGDSWKKEFAQSLTLVYLGIMSFIFFFIAYLLYWYSTDPQNWQVFDEFLKTALQTRYYFLSTDAIPYTPGIGKYLGFLSSAPWFFALMCLAGFVVYTSLRILAQSRELVADAFASQMTSTQTIIRAYSLILMNIMKRSRISRFKKQQWKFAKKMYTFWERWLSFHPRGNERLQSLHDTNPILNYHVQSILLGGVIAEMANWQTSIQIRFYNSDYQILGYTLPFVVGIWLLFVANGFFVADHMKSNTSIISPVLRNAIVYSFGVGIVHAVLVFTFGLSQGRFALESAWYSSFEVLPSVVVYAFILPFTLFVSGLINAAIARYYLRLGITRADFLQKTSLINLLLMLISWNGIFRPFLASFGFASSEFLGIWGTDIWIGIMTLVAIWAVRLQNKTITTKCPNCQSRIRLPANQSQCPECNHMTSQWAFVQDDLVKKSI